MMATAAERCVLFRRAEVRRRRGIRGRRRGRRMCGRCGWRRPERPPAAGLGRSESGVSGQDGNGRGIGRRVLEQHIGTVTVEPAEPRPLARSRYVRSLVHARDDLLADVPRARAERRPRERSRGRRWRGSRGRCRRWAWSRRRCGCRTWRRGRRMSRCGRWHGRRRCDGRWSGNRRGCRPRRRNP